MAHGIKYRGTYYNVNQQRVRVEILKQDYIAPTIYDLRIRSVQITQEWNDYQTACMGTGCEVQLVNEYEDWDFYEELLIAEEQEFMLRVTMHGGVLINFIAFEGFLLTDIQEQQVLPWSEINLKASNYITQLEEIDEMECINGAATHPLITYIGQALQATGLPYNIYVNCSLYETSMTNPRLMEYLLLHKHLFYEGEEEKAQLKYKSLLEIINMIFKPFNIYVYSYNRVWYVERYSDLFHPDSAGTYNEISYKRYNGTTLAYIDTLETAKLILTASPTGDDYNRFLYTETSQTLQYGKGYRKIRVNCVQHKEHNLVNEYFGNAIPYNVVQTLYVPSTDIERWAYDSGGVLNYGEDWFSFTQSGAVTNWAYRGVTQRILLRGTEKENITLNIKFRRQLTQDEITRIVEDTDRFTEIYARISIAARLVIIFADPKYNETLLHPFDFFYLHQRGESGDKNVSYELRPFTLGITSRKDIDIDLLASRDENGWTPHRAWKHDMEGDYYYWEYDVSIPFNNQALRAPFFNRDKYSYPIFREDTLVQVLFGSSAYGWSMNDDYIGSPQQPWMPIPSPVYRKVRITTDDDENDEDIMVEGYIDTNYFEEQSVDIDLFDHTNHSAANAMYINAAFLPTPGATAPIYSEQWLDERTEAESDRGLTLQEHLLEDLFQFFNKPRKKLVTTIRYDLPISPFTIIQDPNITRDGQPIDMLLLSYVWDVNNMTFDIEAEEYVVDEGYRLIDGEIVSPPDGDSDATSDESWESGSSGLEGNYATLTSADFYYVLYKANLQQIGLQFAYVTYYNTVTLMSRNTCVCWYGVTMSLHIYVYTDTIMPGIGNNNYGYFIIRHVDTPNGMPYSTLDSPDPDEIVTSITLTDGTWFWSVTMIQEILNGATHQDFLFETDYAYYALFEGIVDMGGEQMV